MAFEERYVDFFHKGTSVYFFEGPLRFIYLGFIFSRGSIYLLRIYWDLLAVSVFQSTHIGTLPPLSLRPHSQEELCGIDFKIYEDLLKIPINPWKINPGSCWFFLVIGTNGILRDSSKIFGTGHSGSGLFEKEFGTGQTGRDNKKVCPAGLYD
jgi:hypothetical protein